MKTAEERLYEARRAEREARANWFRSLGIAQARLAPDAIAKDAIGQIKDGASEAVDKVTGAARRRPGTIVAVGAAIGLLLLRKPIASALRGKFSKKEATGEDFRSLPEQRIKGRVRDDESAPVTIITEEV